MSSNLALHPSSEDLTWSQHRFYVNWKYLESSDNIDFEIVDCGKIIGKERKGIYILLEESGKM